MRWLGWLLTIVGGTLLWSDPAPAPDSLRQLSEATEKLAAHVRSAVVQVQVDLYAPRNTPELGEAAGLVRREQTIGTGIVIEADGVIVTNAHVVQGARRVRVRFPPRLPNGRATQVDAEVLGLDTETDLALLKVNRTDLRYLVLGDSSRVRQGQLALAFGSPLALENTLTMGVVSAVARLLDPDAPISYIQTDAPINPGNSGGPLVDTDGNVIGINTFIFTQSGGSEGLGFAIPANLVRDVCAQLKQSGRVRRGEVGVYGHTVSPVLATALGLAQEDGVLVEDLVPDGPGERAGLQVEDLIVRAAGRPVRNMRQLLLAISHAGIGHAIRIDVRRGEHTVPLTMTVQEQQDGSAALAQALTKSAVPLPRLGALLADVTPEVRGSLPKLRYDFGVVVAAGLAAGTDGAGSGLRNGDVIYSLNGKLVNSVDMLKQVLAALPDDAPLAVQVQRGERLAYLLLTRGA